MDFLPLSEIIFRKSISRIQIHDGLTIFASERAKFEGWLKVELCSILSESFDDVIPEKDRIDITFQDWAIELKTLNTNYRFPNIVNKTRPITKNVQEVVDDIKKLQTTSYPNKSVLFVVFPAQHNDKNWQIHLQKISANLQDMKFQEFEFKNNVPGILYFGLI
jgi:hypothetical protein